VPREHEALERRLPQIEERAQRRRHRLVQAEDAEVGQAALSRLEQRGPDRGRRGLEPDAREHHLAPGLVRRELHRVAR